MAKEDVSNPADSPSPPSPAGGDKASGKAVKYVGRADSRVIYDHQWTKAGVDGQKTTTWYNGNEYSLPVGDFSTGALAILKKQNGFEVPE